MKDWLMSNAYNCLQNADRCQEKKASGLNNGSASGPFTGPATGLQEMRSPGLLKAGLWRIWIIAQLWSRSAPELQLAGLFRWAVSGSPGSCHWSLSQARAWLTTAAAVVSASSSMHACMRASLLLGDKDSVQTEPRTCPGRMLLWCGGNCLSLSFNVGFGRK